MSLSNELSDIHTARDEAKDAIEAWSQMEGGYRQLVQRNQKIQEIVDGGSFDTIPANIKAALVDLWGVYKAAQVAIEGNADRNELVNWSP